MLQQLGGKGGVDSRRIVGEPIVVKLLRVNVTHGNSSSSRAAFESYFDGKRANVFFDS